MCINRRLEKWKFLKLHSGENRKSEKSFKAALDKQKNLVILKILVKNLASYLRKLEDIRNLRT